MIAKKDLLKQLQGLLDLQEEAHALCSRQLGNAAFFSGLVPQNRDDVRAGLEAHRDRSVRHREVLAALLAGIASGGRDVY